jgi:hypothetical protein
MRKFIVLGLVLVCGFGFGQSKYLNNDGTISDEFKREYLVEIFNKERKDDVRFDIEDKYFVVITKYDCGDETYESKEMQTRASFYSFHQLLSQINSFKSSGGYKSFSDINFEGIIFKTNTICMSSTRRYNYKFNFYELNSLPEYMDFDELCKYVVVKNENRNIIYVKNEK